MPDEKRTRLLLNVLISCAVLAFAITLVRSAWLCDDAYITFRTVDNFLNGYGLTWNVAERVQTYTTPLWLLLLSAAAFVSREFFFTPSVLTILFSLAVVLGLVLKVAPSRGRALLGALLLLFSKAFIDYSTSGMENPLTHLLLVLFVLVYISNGERKGYLFKLSILAALCMTNRMDSILLTFPALAWAVYREPGSKGKAALSLVAGFSPFILWEIFSLFYYGFPFPNTAYAKLSTGIPPQLYLIQGYHYLVESAKLDFLILPAIAVAVGAGLVSGGGKSRPLAIGVLLYMLYVLKIGGDSMAGRFLTAPYLMAVMLLIRLPLWDSSRFLVPAAAVASIVLGLLSPVPPLLTGADYGAEQPQSYHGINDTRAYYYQWTGLLKAFDGNEMPAGPWVERGKFYREIGDELEIRSYIGLVGFFAGPGTYILDNLALGDPLLARLPVMDRENWLIGHFIRFIPYGYIQTLRSGSNELKDKNLREYYGRLTTLIRGRLFSWERIKEIAAFNLGACDHLVGSYMDSLQLAQMYGGTFETSSNGYPSIVRSLKYEDAGMLDSAAAVHAGIIWDEVKLYEEEKWAWSGAMQSIYSKFLQQNAVERWSTAQYLQFQYRVALLRNEKYDLYTFFEGVVNAPLQYGDFRILYPFLDQLDQRPLFEYKYRNLLDNEEVTAHQLTNLAILCDIAGCSDLASDIYIYMAGNDLEPDGRLSYVWAQVLVYRASRYYDSLLGGQGQVAAICFYIRLLEAINDQPHQQMLLNILQNLECPAEDWKKIVDLASATRDNGFAQQIRALAVTKYPEDPAFRP